MTEGLPIFLPGVPEELIRSLFGRAAGNEIESGKFASPQSSAALAANGFGWFLERPEDFPMFPSVAELAGPCVKVEIEREIRFPWSGGRHPWLDAVVHTNTHLIGVESKRYEPFRDAKIAKLADTYDRDVWGHQMERWCAMRDLLRSESRRYKYLDAAQLVKHAFGLATEQTRVRRQPVLLYLYAEPNCELKISDDKFLGHRREIDNFQGLVTGDRVQFTSCSWRAWLESFSGCAGAHAAEMLETFNP